MNKSQKAFLRNFKILSPDSDAVQWNLNDGLMELCEQADRMAAQLQRMENTLSDIQKRLRTLS